MEDDPSTLCEVVDKNYPDFYNTRKQGAEWCDLFVDYQPLHAFGEEIALKMLHQPRKSCGAGVKYSAQYYKKSKAWYTKPEFLDQIFFKNSDGICHTGLVIKVTSSRVYTIEGNVSNMVKTKDYPLNSTKIAGYGRMDWSMFPVNPDPKGDKVMVELTVLKRGSKGEEVKTVQRLLKSLGYKGKGKVLSIDGSYGPATVDAVESFQKAKKLTVDGICGKATWDKLLKG